MSNILILSFFLKKIGLKVVSPKNEVFAQNIIQRRDQIILLMEEKEILQNEIINKDNNINELHEQLRQLNEEKEEILNSKAYRFGQKAARVYRKIKF
jgi:tetrahydromethanopterin S-methyltransferase subunit G